MLVEETNELRKEIFELKANAQYYHSRFEAERKNNDELQRIMVAKQSQIEELKAKLDGSYTPDPAAITKVMTPRPGIIEMDAGYMQRLINHVVDLNGTLQRSGIQPPDVSWATDFGTPNRSNVQTMDFDDMMSESPSLPGQGSHEQWMSGQGDSGQQNLRTPNVAQSQRMSVPQHGQSMPNIRFGSSPIMTGAGRGNTQIRLPGLVAGIPGTSRLSAPPQMPQPQGYVPLEERIKQQLLLKQQQQQQYQVQLQQQQQIPQMPAVYTPGLHPTTVPVTSVSQLPPTIYQATISEEEHRILVQHRESLKSKEDVDQAAEVLKNMNVGTPKGPDDHNNNNDPIPAFVPENRPQQ